MDKVEICRQLKKTVRKVIIEDHTRVLSSGTGVVVRSDGALLTARHVIEKDGVGVYHGKILAYGMETEPVEYQPVLSGLKLDIQLPDMIQSLVIDLTILKPTSALTGMDFVPLSPKLAEAGTDVIIAGFPDDIGPPLDFTDRLNTQNPEIDRLKKAYDGYFKYHFRQCMFKHGMVGHVQKIDLKMNVASLVLPGLENVHASGAEYWLDNHLTYGGSGGPIVNTNGELVGIVCQRAFTAADPNEREKKIPSGTGMGLSHQLISWILDTYD